VTNSPTSFLRAFVPRSAITLFIDAIFLLVFVLSPFVPYVGLAAVLGAVIVAVNVVVASLREMSLPRMWILSAVALPTTTYVNLSENVWQGEPRRTRYRRDQAPTFIRSVLWPVGCSHLHRVASGMPACRFTSRPSPQTSVS